MKWDREKKYKIGETRQHKLFAWWPTGLDNPWKWIWLEHYIVVEKFIASDLYLDFGIWSRIKRLAVDHTEDL